MYALKIYIHAYNESAAFQRRGRKMKKQERETSLEKKDPSAHTPPHPCVGISENFSSVFCIKCNKRSLIGIRPQMLPLPISIGIFVRRIYDRKWKPLPAGVVSSVLTLYTAAVNGAAYRLNEGVFDGGGLVGGEGTTELRYVGVGASRRREASVHLFHCHRFDLHSRTRCHWGNIGQRGEIEISTL